MHDTRYFDINGLIGSTIIVDEQRLYVERVISESDLLIHRLSGDQKGEIFKVENPIDGSREFPGRSWLDDVQRRGVLRILKDKNGPIVRHEPVESDLDHDEIAKKDPLALARRTVVRELALAGINVHDRHFHAEAERIWREKGFNEISRIPSRRTVREWCNSVDDPLEATLLDMMSMTGRAPRAARLDPEVVDILKTRARWYYALRGRRKKDVRPEVHADVDDANVKRAKLGLEKLEYPSKETIRRHINAAECRDTFAEKWGEAAAKAKWDGAGKSLSAPKILAVGLIDDTVFDAVTVFDAERNIPAGRPYFCAVLDVHSRCVPGFVVSYTPPTVHTAAECLRRANRPKIVPAERLERYPGLSRIAGKFSSIVADHGKNYVSPKFQEILADLGITLKLTAVGSPRHKAMIERFFFTLKTWLADKLPGATLDPKLLKEFDLDPEKEAVLTLTELENLIEEFLFVYHVSVHSGIDAQPLRRWNASAIAYGRDIIADESKLDVLTGVTLRGRRLYKGAVRLKGLVFRDREISARLNDSLVRDEPHRQRLKGGVVATVDIKYNPADMRQILVRDPGAGEWLPLPCTDQEYAAGLSLWQHEQVQAWAKKRNVAFNTEAERLSALRQLNRLILEHAPDMAARERRAMARMLSRAPGATPSPTCEIVTAEPRHDGMAPVIEHETAENRSDADGSPSRPRPKRGTPTRPTRAEEDRFDDGEDGTGGDPAFVGALDGSLLDSPENDDERFEEMA